MCQSCMTPQDSSKAFLKADQSLRENNHRFFKDTLLPPEVLGSLKYTWGDQTYRHIKSMTNNILKCGFLLLFLSEWLISLLSIPGNSGFIALMEGGSMGKKNRYSLKVILLQLKLLGNARSGGIVKDSKQRELMLSPDWKEFSIGESKRRKKWEVIDSRSRKDLQHRHY